MAMSLRRWLARLIRFELGLFLLLAFLAKVGAAGSQIPPDPYPNIYPGGERPKHFAAAAVYTGNPAKGGDRKGWVNVEPPLLDAASQPPPPVDNSWENSTTTVQVLIASFRDDLCGKTLFNLFTKAQHPDRISVSVVQQNAGEDMDCSDKMCSLFKNAEVCAKRKAQVRTYNVPSTEAKGPVFARALASRMVMPDSQFCMQIDSHMDFAPGWENHLLEFWCSTKNEYAVLSTYVADMRQLGKCVNGQFEVPHLCQVIKSVGNVPRNSQAKAARMLTSPLLTTLWAAGLSFSKCHFERRVPNDPNLPFVFDGEEFSRTLRGWTWGYDFYTPPRVVVGHRYNRPRKGHWAMSDGSDGARLANRRMQLLMHLPLTSGSRLRRNEPVANVSASGSDAGQRELKERAAVQASRYGLGPRRTSHMYREWSKIDTGSDPKPVQGQCTDHRWVPWATPYASLTAQAAASSSARDGRKVAAGDDALWALDNLSWPPPREGSLAHLDPRADPATPSATHWALKASNQPAHRPILDEDDADDLAHPPSGAKVGGGAVVASGQSSAESSDGRGDHRRGSDVKSSSVSPTTSRSEVVSRADAPPVSAVAAETRRVEPLSEEMAPTEGGNLEAAPSIWALGGRIPPFVGKATALAVLVNMLVVLRLVLPMTPLSRWLCRPLDDTPLHSCFGLPVPQSRAVAFATALSSRAERAAKTV